MWINFKKMTLELNNPSDEYNPEEDELYTEVEDIMCDQGIISIDVDFHNRSSTIAVSATRFRVAVAVLTKAVVPVFVGVYYAYLRNQKTVVESVRRQLLPTVLSFLANSVSRSLASVQRGITFPLNLRAIKHHESEPLNSEISDEPERSVECCILAQPDPPQPIIADVIFIHGLHGGLDKTWKQGQWRNDAHQTKRRSFERSYASTGDLHITYREKRVRRSISDIYMRSHKRNSQYEDKVNNVSLSSSDDESVNSGEEESYSKCWPQDWLPKDFPGIRVIALNYTTDMLWRPVYIKKRNRTSMVQRSQEMIEELLQIGVGAHPIIWVGHSKGGLYIKQIIVNAWDQRDTKPHLRDIYKSTKGIMFYSVPHKGSSLADFTLPLLRKSVELTEIQRNCYFVLDLHRRFLEICENNSFRPEIFSFIETAFTFMSFLYLKIVAYDSADPGIGMKCEVPLDHREICKPAGRDCFLYLELVKLIKRVLSSETS